jgi:hypothetical protein
MLKVDGLNPEGKKQNIYLLTMVLIFQKPIDFKFGNRFKVEGDLDKDAKFVNGEIGDRGGVVAVSYEEPISGTITIKVVPTDMPDDDVIKPSSALAPGKAASPH